MVSRRVVIAILAGLAFAGAAATVPNAGALGGLAGGSRFVVSDAHYVLSGPRAGGISEVVFTIDGSPRTVSIRLSAGGPWHRCVIRAGRGRCAVVPPAPAASVDRLHVVATG